MSVKRYFNDAYPEVARVDDRLATVTACGYGVVAPFIPGEPAWWDAYYGPLERRLEFLRTEYATAPDKIELIESSQTEIEMYRRYSSYYGYVFYLMRRLVDIVYALMRDRSAYHPPPHPVPNTAVVQSSSISVA